MKKLIEQLERIEWSSFDTYDTTAEGTSQGKEIKLEVKYQLNNGLLNATELPVTASLNMLVDGVHAYRWDMSRQSDQGVFAKWFLRKENETRTVTYKAEDKARDDAKAFFKAI